VVAVPLILLVGGHVGSPGHALGILGGGYGAAQIAITGTDWLPAGWHGAELLLFLCAVKLIATSLTIGTGGSAGDFGPSLVLGGLFGGAFGRAAAALLHDPTIDPGAFALVGMGTFYGGLAHVPVSSLIMVCEMAGSYDLLVPLMLAEGIAFVALRKRSLYHAQVPTHADSPVHRVADSLEVLARKRVGDVLTARTPFCVFGSASDFGAMRSALAEASWQTTFPVVGADGKLIGLVKADSIGLLSPDKDVHREASASDLMQPPASLSPDDDLRRGAEIILRSGFRQLPVVGTDETILGFIEESEVTRAYLNIADRRSDVG
jgi:CIC family chloride channel protein